MLSNLARRTGAVLALVLAVSLVAAAGPVSSAGTTATSIAIRATAKSVQPGTSVTILGNLRLRSGEALGGKSVTLEARLGGESGFQPIGTALSGPRGGLALEVAPAETTRYRWVYSGDAASRGSRSGVVAVPVRVPANAPARTASTLSIRSDRPVASRTGTAVISGRLLARRVPLRNQAVILLDRAAGSQSWRFLRAAVTGKNGMVRFVVSPQSSTAYRLVFQGSATVRKARSGVVRVAERSTHLTSAVSAPTVAPGGSATMSGLLTRAGLAFSDQEVQLWGRPLRSAQKFALMQTASTGSDGQVAFTLTPPRTMQYFLVFPRTAQAPAAQSPARTIAVS